MYRNENSTENINVIIHDNTRELKISVRNKIYNVFISFDSWVTQKTFSVLVFTYVEWLLYHINILV